jgi:tRNA (pseudouridine54-N1)-methyltransferase
VIRRFVVIGQKATASDDFILDDLPGTSGRLDILVRCLRAALLSSHGVRHDVIAYLVLLGGPRAPRVLRIDGALAHFLRPDERSLAVLVKKVLALPDDGTTGFVQFRRGIAIARGGIERVLADAPAAVPFVLEEGAPDIRAADDMGAVDPLLVIGDHFGIPEEARAGLEAIGARRVSIGPVSVHADDVVAIVNNELDRRAVAR